ncbi:MAG: GGDEF domain-containing protein [Lachnospiraceae bacterium]|nr:GGDEF domain-containing protein [Lachnospiraceae bacterium]
MRRKKQITNKTIVMTAVIGSLIVMGTMIANMLWTSRQTAVATSEAVGSVSTFYLEAMADRRAKTITNLINNNFDHMQKAVDFIAGEDIGSQEELRDCLGEIKSLLGLNRFALVDEDNIVYTQYTTYTGRSRHSFLADESLNARIITTVSLYGSSKQLCLAIPTPDLVVMGKHFKACFVQVDIREIVELLAFDDQGRTHFALYAQNGGNLSGTRLGPVIKEYNLFDSLKGIVSEEVWKENYANFEYGKGGNITFELDGAEETLCYVPIRDTGWEMAVLIRDSVIQDQIRSVSEKSLKTTRIQIIFTLVTVLILAAILLHQLGTLSREKLEEEKETSRSFRDMANTDSMTGVRNKHAYTEKETNINEQINAGELKELAVVIGDINGLKAVNDTLGHAAGDQLIKDACNLVCEYFKHGAVYRIGGDEFVVLLEGTGYDSMLETVGAFNRKVEENIKEGAVVVSIGYSSLKPDDRELSDVFGRADQMMYERKKELKAMGAQTR